MDNGELRCFRTDTELTDYMPIPRQLVGADLPSTALLLYGALLDRGTLSRKNGYADEGNWVYVIYPVEKLAQTFRISDTAVKNHLRLLEHKGLIRRHRQSRGGPSHIFLRLPTASIKAPDTGRDIARKRNKSSAATGRNLPPNNVRQQQDQSNYYQHREEESL